MPDTLNIFLPNGGGMAIADFQDGDFGLSGNFLPYNEDDGTFLWDEDLGKTIFQSNIPISNIAYNGEFSDYANLSGAYELIATPGIFEPPVAPDYLLY